MITLHPHQQLSVKSISARYRSGARRVLFVLPTGGGKTVVFCHIISRIAASGGRVLLLVHRRELLSQASASLQRLGVEHGLIQAGQPMDLSMPVQVASVQTVARRLEQIPPELFTFLVVDECFPAGTPVDGRPIETLQVGDVVSCFDHQSGQITSGRVKRLFCNPMPRWMVRVTTTSGKSIETTLSHLFFTFNHGYIPAGILRPGDELLCAMPLVRSLDCSKNEDQARPAKSQRPRLLQPGVLQCLIEQAKSRGDGENQPKARIATHAEQQPDAAARVQGKNERNAAAQQPSATGTWRQWPWTNQAAAATSRFPWLADGSGHPNGDAARQWLPDLLQARYRLSGAADRHRSGWQIPWLNPTPNAGQEKGGFPFFDRVERVEVYEQANRGRSGGLREVNYVYNIEVENHHNYFADGLLVHNCHHSCATTWASVINHFERARLLGVTATPIRADGRGLGEFYEEMVVGPTPAWLTQEGYLAPARVLAPPIGFDPKAVGKRMGDFRMDEAAEQLGRQQVGDAIGHYLQHLEGKTAIAFCCSVAHAEAVAEAFGERGVTAASIDGTTKNRAELLAALGEGSLKVLTSCELIGEGVDVPSVGGCILLRPTQSEALHLQMIGRCLRPQAGKTAVILDHVGNVRRLGHHLEERQWTLEGRRVRHREKSESVTVCPKCFSCLRSGSHACPDCGHEFESQERRRLQVVDGTLQEISVEQARRVRLREQASATTMEELVEVGRRRGMKNPHGWARHVMAGRQTRGHWRSVR